MKRRIDQCFKCGRRKCYYRVYTDDLRFDEVACYEHSLDMERHADATLNGAVRNHLLSSRLLKRGDEPFKRREAA